MPRIKEKYKYSMTPVANQDAIIQGDKYRFTVLTSSLVRMEYNERGIFEDRATQTVVNRVFNVPDYHVSEKNGELRIQTDKLTIVYCGETFATHTLSARFAGELGWSPFEWHFGDTLTNLGGTVRTLDEVDGACDLGIGVLSRTGMSVLDDGKSLIIAEDGWVDIREDGIIDIYLFAHGNHYQDAMNDFYQLTGKTPLIPRYALGNWWSRYYRYTQEEYQQLMLEFEKRCIPLSVAVIDMDWHKVQIEPKYGSGWTGFSWNKELFPDHKGFLKFLHEQGLEPSLNLHPAEGIAAHEDCYVEVAKEMGVDIEAEEKVRFDVTNPKFIETYFDKILTPMEEEGVSFWWMDWQQGSVTKIPQLDPLWMLNHYHFVDMQSKNKRAMIFSRYAGPGSHRYPIGFSGDTYSTWESLNFQPYFTATASNIGYSWWSHDIGGHLPAKRDDEMIARWVQYGVFSPIMRLHSCNTPFQGKEPWKYNLIVETVIVKFMKLRHQMIPYLYTMNYLTHSKNIPLIRPLYYDSPYQDSAYSYNRNQYMFGSEMLVSPITSKADDVTVCGCAKTYFPKGTWFDFFNSRKYYGDRCCKVYRDIYTMPVFVKAGGIIPLAEPEEVNDISNPKTMRLVVFPGADNTFTLYEDDGNTMEYEIGAYAETVYEYKWKKKPQFTIHKPIGDANIIVSNRNYTVEFRKISKCTQLCVTQEGENIPYEVSYENDTLYVQISNVNGVVQVAFMEDVFIPENDYKKDVMNLLYTAQWHDLQKVGIQRVLEQAKTPSEFVSGIMAMDMDTNLREAMIELAMA